MHKEISIILIETSVCSYQMSWSWSKMGLYWWPKFDKKTYIFLKDVKSNFLQSLLVQ